MKRSVRIIIPIILIAIFIAVMTTGALLKRPFGTEDDVMELIAKMETEVLNNEWDKASQHLDEAKKAWTKVVHRIQFSAERGEISTLHKSLDRTEGFIKAEDVGGAMAELAEARHIWKELGK
ncbi:DUF4363 family protein [Pseudogracilibacillus sp. SE30717A]|uniref:DUF4363 family protein n=1 Tax=Pseudogracilibacillus sp. SE30717A TaxID=3098293 RepID=UPI00300E430F